MHQKKQWITKEGPWWPVTCWSKHWDNNSTRRLHSSSNGWIEAYSIWCHSQTFHLFQGFLYTWLWWVTSRWAKVMGFRSWDDSCHGFMYHWKISCSCVKPLIHTSLQHHPRKLERRWVHCTFPGFRWKVVCHEVLSKWKKLYQKPGCSLDIGGNFPFQKNRGFSRGYSLPFVCDGHPPRHTTSVGRMPNCCIFWKWAWRAGWKNLSFGFLSVDFLLKFHQRSFQFVDFPKPISFHTKNPSSLKP